MKTINLLEYVKKRLYILIGFIVLLTCVFLFLYIDDLLKKDSSNDYLNYLLYQDKSFLEKKQYGFYEKIRKSILEKDLSLLKELSKDEFLYHKLYLFAKKLDHYSNNEFDSIFESEKSLWRDLFIATKVFANQDIRDEKISNFLKIYTIREK